MSRNGRSRSGSGSKKRPIDDDEGDDDSGNGHSALDRKMRHQVSFQTMSRGTIHQENSTSTLSSGSASDDPTPAMVPVSAAPLHARESQPWPLQNSSDHVLSVAVQRLLSHSLEGINHNSGAIHVPLPTSASVSSIRQPGLTTVAPPLDATSPNQATMMRILIDMLAARSEQHQIGGMQGLLNMPQQAGNAGSTLHDLVNAALSGQSLPQTYHGSTLASSDQVLQSALQNALQQHLEAARLNQVPGHHAATFNQALSSAHDSRLLLSALTSHLGTSLPPTISVPALGRPAPVPDRSVSLQQLIGQLATDVARYGDAQHNSAQQQPPHASVVALAALLLQSVEGRNVISSTPIGTDISALSTSGTSSTYAREMEGPPGLSLNQVPNLGGGLTGPFGILPTQPALPVLQESTRLEGLPSVISMGSSGLPPAFVPAIPRLPLPDSILSLPVGGPVRHVPDRKLPRLLHVASDDDVLSPYQCLVRKQIELFEASEADIHATAQGRNRPIVLRQVGIRCVHCGRFPIEKRARGAVYFPSTLMSTYQTAQNMANSHLIKDCLAIPKSIREDLIRIRLRENSESQNTRKSAFGGGRTYWARGLQTNHGVIETNDRRLKFDPTSIVDR